MTTKFIETPPVEHRLDDGLHSFYLILIGQFISLAGSGLTRFALGVWIYQRSGAATEYALNSLAAVLPFIAVTPFAGAVVDRWSRRWSLIVSTAGAALSTLMLAVVLYYGKLEVWHVYLATALSAAFAAFQSPAFSASIPYLVTRHDLGRANGLVQLATGVAQIVAPILAGALIAKIQVSGVLIVDLASFLIAIGTLAVVHIPQPATQTSEKKPATSLLSTAAEGWHYLATQRGLMELMVLFGVVNFFMGLVVALATPLVLSSFHPAALGSVMTLGGIGVLCASLSMGWMGCAGRRTHRLLWFAALCGVFIATAGLRPSLPLVAISAFCIFFCLELVNGCSTILLQTKVMPAMQGRVFSLSTLIATSTMPLAFLVAGPLADRVFEPLLVKGGPLAASLGTILGTGHGRGIGLLFVVIGVLIVVSVGAGSLLPRLRNLDIELEDVGFEHSSPPKPSQAGTTVPDHTKKPILPPVPTSAGFLAAGLVGLVLAGSIWYSRIEVSPPPVVPASAPATEFSAERAFQYLPHIARAPHPIGSPENTRVRTYLLEQLRGLGLDPQVQSASTVIRKDDFAINIGDVQNIVARIPGTASTGAIVLVAHYDSVPTGPGASDDGVSVAAILETARALQSGRRFKNDVIVLLTDGEEVGLLGAQGFVNEHPWAKDVGLVLNFEAAGTGGKSLLFETSDGNGWLIAEAAKADAGMQTNSFFQEAYKLLPNLTDFKVFKRAGMPGFNFAFLDSPFHYHTEQDNLENLDPRSIQHHGGQALALTRHFGNLDLKNRTATDAVYVTLFQGVLLHYSQGWVWVILVLATGWFGWAINRGIHHGYLSRAGIRTGIGAFGLVTLISAGGMGVFWWITGALRVRQSPVSWSDWYHLHYFQAGFALFALCTAVSIYSRFRKTTSVFDLSTGALAWWLTGGIGTTLLWPGASYLFVWPFLGALVGVTLTFAKPASVRSVSTAMVYSLAGALPGFLVIAPVTYFLFVGLPLDMAWVSGLFECFLLGLLVLPLGLIENRIGLASQAVTGIAALALVLAGSLVSSYDSGHKQPDSIFYVLNSDTGKAIWASTDEYSSEWTSQFFESDARPGPVSEFFPEGQYQLLNQSAPTVALLTPTIDLLEDQVQAGIRTVRVKITSPRKASLVKIVLKKESGLRSCQLNGRLLDLQFPSHPVSSRWATLWYWGFPESGAELTFDVALGSPFTFVVTDVTFDLPQTPTKSWLPRNPNVMSMPHGFGVAERTLVTKSFQLSQSVNN